MYKHASENYVCPICLGVKGVENDATLIRQSDIVFKDNLVTAFISSFFIGDNSGHVVIVPNKHFEAIFDLSNNYLVRIHEISKKVAIAIKEEYGAGGITILQNNEPAGDQHAFHYHLHVFPRYKDDQLHKNMEDKKSTSVEDRLPYAEKLRKYFNKQKK